MAETDVDGIFGSPFLYWIGLDTDPGASATAVADFNRFYDEIHVPEVLSHNRGFTHAARFRLEVPDARGDLGPMWLAVYAVANESAAEQYLAREGDPSRLRTPYTPGPALWKGMSVRWRLVWERVLGLGTPGRMPDQLFVVGMDPAPESTAADLAQFEKFYSDTHLPEVVNNGGFAAGTRLRLRRELMHPAPGSPRFGAVYEGIQATQGTQLGQYSSGPPSWEGRDTRWRLRYRLATEQAKIS